jgi:hypothetical protein
MGARENSRKSRATLLDSFKVAASVEFPSATEIRGWHVFADFGLGRVQFHPPF